MTKKRTFFIVDDDTDDQELFIEAVNEIDSSIECIASTSGEQALEMLTSESFILPDMIFLDLNMPKLNGKQFLVELKKLDRVRDIPVIIYSTSSEKRDKEETSRLGAAHFMTKPNKFDELCRSLAFVLQQDWKVKT